MLHTAGSALVRGALKLKKFNNPSSLKKEAPSPSLDVYDNSLSKYSALMCSDGLAIRKT